MSRMYEGNLAKQLETQPVIATKQKPKSTQKQNVVTLTEKQKRQSLRQSLKPLSITVQMLCVLTFFALSTIVIYGYVQITELSNDIVVASTTLTSLEKEQVSLEMEISTIMNSIDVENYAENQLGMSSVNSNQIIYVTMESENQGEVITEKSVNVFEKILDWLGFR
ncbi:MAG: hypothetical protein R3Y35_07905 [Clostridia bacterium]